MTLCGISSKCFKICGASIFASDKVIESSDVATKAPKSSIKKERLSSDGARHYKPLHIILGI